MASSALNAFLDAVHEVVELQQADPTPLGDAPISPETTRVIGRASVVLLSSHFERYVYAVNEEATGALNNSGVAGDALPEFVRLLHSRPSVDALLATSWEGRSDQLATFVESEGWMWQDATAGYLEHARLLAWMKSPAPKCLVRFYRYWGIENIFDAITRATHTRTDLWLKIDELVRKRNNIAHGDPTTEATLTDVRSYRNATRTFCERADRQFAQALKALLGGALPW